MVKNFAEDHQVTLLHLNQGSSPRAPTLPWPIVSAPTKVDPNHNREVVGTTNNGACLRGMSPDHRQPGNPPRAAGRAVQHDASLEVPSISDQHFSVVRATLVAFGHVRVHRGMQNVL